MQNKVNLDHDKTNIDPTPFINNSNVTDRIHKIQDLVHIRQRHEKSKREYKIRAYHPKMMIAYKGMHQAIKKS